MQEQQQLWLALLKTVGWQKKRQQQQQLKLNLLRVAFIWRKENIHSNTFDYSWPRTIAQFCLSFYFGSKFIEKNLSAWRFLSSKSRHCSMFYYRFWIITIENLEWTHEVINQSDIIFIPDEILDLMALSVFECCRIIKQSKGDWTICFILWFETSFFSLPNLNWKVCVCWSPLTFWMLVSQK